MLILGQPPRGPALRQSVVGEKPDQHATGLLLLDDTGKCPVQPEDASGGTYTRHCARVQDPLYRIFTWATFLYLIVNKRIKCDFSGGS